MKFKFANWWHYSLNTTVDWQLRDQFVRDLPKLWNYIANKLPPWNRLQPTVWNWFLLRNMINETIVGNTTFYGILSAVYHSGRWVELPVAVRKAGNLVYVVCRIASLAKQPISQSRRFKSLTSLQVMKWQFIVPIILFAWLKKWNRLSNEIF